MIKESVTVSSPEHVPFQASHASASGSVGPPPAASNQGSMVKITIDPRCLEAAPAAAKPADDKAPRKQSK